MAPPESPSALGSSLLARAVVGQSVAKHHEIVKVGMISVNGRISSAKPKAGGTCVYVCACALHIHVCIFDLRWPAGVYVCMCHSCDQVYQEG